MWGRRAFKKDTARAPELERLAGLAEACILALPQAEKERALHAVETIAAGGAELRTLPDDLADLLGRMVTRFVLELFKPAAMRPLTPRQMVLQAVAGAPTLLGPHRERIERLLGAVEE